jgi:hypothetical protein
MKKITTFLLALVLGVFMFTACDKVDDPFYEVITQEDVTVVFPDIDPASVYRKVLVEEFTGHRCTNCPQGHQILENLHEQYGDTLVTVGIHFGSLAKPSGSLFSYDFRTEAGNQIGEAFTIDAIPAAIMNRNDKVGGWMRDQWANVVRDIDRSQVPAAVQLINQYDDATKTLKANVKVTLLHDYDNPLRLVVFVIEDGIVKPQKDGSQDIEDYVHNHVLRTALTDPFGFPLRNNETWSAGDSETYAVSVDMANTDWEAGNCSVVAFLLDPVNNDVLQVEQVAVK